MTSLSGSRESADQSAIDCQRELRDGAEARAAAMPTATCPMLATLLVLGVFDFETARNAFDLVADGKLAHRLNL